MQLTSAAYQEGDRIPSKYTCDGDNISPEFSWRDAPKETKSFAFVIHDPDAPGRDGFAHWVLYNIPPSIAAIDPRVPKRGSIQGLGMQGKNDSGSLGYMGPCPPSGTHRYFARVYALRDKVNLQPGATYAELMSAIQNLIIEQAELMGTYAKLAQRAA
jgi:Raf kinase inhibitor-like YbhB/YbcL family protein